MQFFKTVVGIMSMTCALPALANNHFEAFQVYIDKVDNYQIRFTDGSNAHYVADQPLQPYYLDRVVIYRDGSNWTMCYKGDRYELDTIERPTQAKKRIKLDINYVELDLLPDCF
ncbi:hypothetical protein [Vibrio owensii]|uniref:hypothetical protein n=1 Tax=Vibrio owensii TaxID=696485 RepID=UPI004067EE53